MCRCRSRRGVTSLSLTGCGTDQTALSVSSRYHVSIGNRPNGQGQKVGKINYLWIMEAKKLYEQIRKKI